MSRAGQHATCRYSFRPPHAHPALGQGAPRDEPEGDPPDVQDSGAGSRTGGSSSPNGVRTRVSTLRGAFPAFRDERSFPGLYCRAWSEGATGPKVSHSVVYLPPGVLPNCCHSPVAPALRRVPLNCRSVEEEFNRPHADGSSLASTRSIGSEEVEPSEPRPWRLGASRSIDGLAGSD